MPDLDHKVKYQSVVVDPSSSVQLIFQHKGRRLNLRDRVHWLKTRLKANQSDRVMVKNQVLLVESQSVPHPRSHQRDQEIGRASCRERGERSVGGGGLEEKRKAE